jgi:hypothetical protein
MQWIEIIPRKARPKCYWCKRRARWRCDTCAQPKNCKPAPAYFCGITVCDAHKTDMESQETSDLLRELKDADTETRNALYRYLADGGFQVVIVLSEAILAQSIGVVPEIAAICLAGGDEFARLLAREAFANPGPVVNLIHGLLKAVKPEACDAANQVISVLGLFAKHGVQGSIDALRACSKNQDVRIRDAASRYLDTWEKLGIMETAMYSDRRRFFLNIGRDKSHN